MVPASTRVRPSRVHNIDTCRLVRRLGYLRDNMRTLARGCDGRASSGLVGLAREVHAIQRELPRRGCVYDPRGG